MMHIPLPECMLKKHENYVIEDGELREDLEVLKGKSEDNISTEILKFTSRNLDEIVGCDFEGLKKMKNQYIKLIGGMSEFSKVESNDYKPSDVKKFQKIHKELGVVFLKAYDRFKKINKNATWNSYIYIMELGQTVCPYCNANFIQTVQAEKRLKGTGSRATADLDHFLPKSVYPIFAITLSNLIPSCMYCNQRFKGAYQTNFHDYLSPFDPEITDAIKFKIHYEKDNFSSVFNKLEHKTPGDLSREENHYIKLLSLEQIDQVIGKYKECLETIKEQQSEVRRELDELQENHLFELSYLVCARDRGEEPLVFSNLVTTLLDKSTVYIEKTETFIEFFQTNGVVYVLNDYACKLVGLFNELTGIVEESRKYSKKKENIEVGKAITKLKNKMKKHKEYLEANFLVERFESDTKDDKIDFVDTVLGYSTNYQIEIIANKDLNEEIQRKAYNNAALFQLETVYNQFHSYINRRIRQSHVLSDLYKSQLAQQFSNLLNETMSFDLGEVLLIDPESQRHEVLGKLTHDVILPAIKYKNKLELLREEVES